MTVTGALKLREVADSDLPIFFEQQLDPEANRMAAFTSDDPTDRAAFDAHWTKIRAAADITIRTILLTDAVAGYIVSFERAGDLEVSYWIGKEHWGKGVATRTLAAFLDVETRRPIYARVATDNAGSLRVLQKCGFEVTGEERGFANARGEEIAEYILALGGAN